MAAAKKSASKKKSATKKAAASTPAARKPAAKKPAGKKKAAAKSAPVAKKKAAAKKPAAKKPAGKKKAAAKSAPAATPKKKAAAKQPAAKKTAAPAKKSAAKKAPVKKTVTKKTAAAKPKAKPKPKPMNPSRTSLLSNDVPEVHEIPAPRGTTKDGIAYTKDFDVKFLKVQRDELLARKASEIRRATRLEDEAESLIEDGEMGDVQFDDEGGEGDTMVVQRDLDRLLSSQARQTVEEVDLALARMEAGTYGYSEVSGLPIPRERLEALPETTVLAVEKVSGAGLR